MKPVEKKVNTTTQVFKVMQIKSGAGRLKNQIRTLKAMGLGKINRVVELPENPSARGMVNAVKHLVKIL